jgi:hypothetical protein
MVARREDSGGGSHPAVAQGKSLLRSASLGGAGGSRDVTTIADEADRQLEAAERGIASAQQAAA